jgi:hypothetical protein
MVKKALLGTGGTGTSYGTRIDEKIVDLPSGYVKIAIENGHL